MVNKRWLSQMFKTTLVWLLVFMSCTPEEITFPEEDVTSLTFTRSSGIVSLFNEVIVGKTSVTDLCFEFDYPIIFKTHSELIVTINDAEGLEELIRNQTSGVYVDQVVYPISVTAPEFIEIADKTAFQELISQCGIASMKDLFFEYYGTCFDFEYPFSVVDAFDGELAIVSQQALNDFQETLPEVFTLELAYPVTVPDHAIIYNDFELYQKLFNTCKTCPSLSFIEIFVDDVIQQGDSITRHFEADFEEVSTLGYYEWSVDDQVVDIEGIDNNGDNRLAYTFTESGVYEVCMFTETPDCPEGISFCEEITVEIVPIVSCPELSFTYSKYEEVYYFEADFEEVSTLGYYVWSVDDQVVGIEGIDNNGDNRLTYEFTESGIYSICIFTERADCPQGFSFCEEVVIE